MLKLGPTPTVGNPEEEENITGSGILPKKKGVQPHIGHPNPEIEHQEDKAPFPGLENQGGLPEGCRN